MFTPVSVSVPFAVGPSVSPPPATLLIPPASAITPPNVVSAPVRVRVCAPRKTVPVWPAAVLPRLWIDAPAVVCEISKTPPVASETPLEFAMLPAPDSASAPAAIVVAPV